MSPADLGLDPAVYFIDHDPARAEPVVARRADGVAEYAVRGGRAVPLAAAPGGFSFSVSITPPGG